MGKDQDLLDAARTGNVVTIHKILSARPKNALSQAIAISFRRSVAPNCQDSSGYTPLHHAVLNGHRLAVEVLLKHAASPGIPDAKGSTPFHLAAWTGGADIIRILMSRTRAYSQINEQNNDWDTPLHFAAQYGHTDVVKILLESGADPTINNKREETPLDLAAQYGRLETVELLLARRPELLRRIPEQRSILHLAARNGHPQVIKALLEAGCDINKKLKTGSALHEAAIFGKVEAVRVLLEHHPPISVSLKDASGQTALQKVEGYPSKVAVEIAALIKAHIRGDPLPPSTLTPCPQRKANQPIDIEQQSTYDNLPPADENTPPPRPPATPPTVAALRHSAHTPPLVKKPARPFRPSEGAVSKKTANYMNVDIPTKVPPKKPARSSIGILLDRPEVSSSPRVESPLVNSSASMYEMSSAPPSNNPVMEQRSPESEKPPPPLPDRNYYDEDVAGEYTELRRDASKAPVSASASVPLKSSRPSVKCPVPPSSTPPSAGVPMRSASSKHRHVYASNDEPFISSKEDVNEVRRSLLLDKVPLPIPAPAPAPVPTPVSAPVSAPVPSSSSESESFYEDLSEAYSGDVVMNKQLQDHAVHKQHLEVTAPGHSTMGSSTGSDLDTDVYELLSDATTGRNKNYDVPPPTMTLSSVDSVPEEQPRAREGIPVPPPRRSKKLGPNSSTSTPTIPLPPVNNLNGGLPVSAANSYYSDFPSSDFRSSDFRSSDTDDSDVMPSSPGSYYSQPPTPDHPPPSPHTAMLGIQAKLSPQQQTDTHSYQDRGPVNNNSNLNPPVSVRQRDSDGYQANDEFLSVTDTSSSGETELLKLSDEDPFAGLIYGSNRGSRNLSLEAGTRFSFSQYMADWPVASSSRTSMIGENGLLDAPTDGGGGGGGGSEENAGGIDENSEWAQIESIMASFGAGLVRESVYIRDFQKEFEKMFEGPTKPQSVGAWLENLGMGQYENMLIANGFDNLDFMGGNIIEENDLIEMGVMEELHRKIILQSTSALPVMKTINHEGNMPSSVSEWLRSLLLSDCIPHFIDNGITTMERARELWEVELENVLEVHMLGHRKRILASLGERRHSCTSSSSSIQRPDSLELTTDDLELNLSSFERRRELSSTASEQSTSLDIDLFKDYSKEVTTPTKPKPLPNFSTANEQQQQQQQQQSDERTEQQRAAARQTSDIEDYDNIQASGRATDRGSGLEEPDSRPTSPAVQWMHPPEALIKGCCNYTASYLGSTLVKEAKGVDSTQESCTKLRRSASHLQKIPSITLSISYMGVKFIDFKSKLIITEHEIHNISCVTQDSDDLRTFAYITKDSENEKLYCHVFSVKAEEIAREIILTLGQVFEIAYQMFLKSRPTSNEHTRQLSNVSENEYDTKL